LYNSQTRAVEPEPKFQAPDLGSIGFPLHAIQNCFGSGSTALVDGTDVFVLVYSWPWTL